MRTDDDRILLPNGLRVYGATVADVRLYQFVREYFESGIELRPGMTVLDVGANVGLFSLEVLRRCGGDVRLLAFEPAPATFAHLERNIRELFPSSPVQLFQFALATERGESAFYYRPRAPVLSSLSRERSIDWGAHADALLRPKPPPAFRDVLPDRIRRLPRWVTRPLVASALRWMARRVVETPCTVTTVSHVIREHDIQTIDFLKIDVEGAELNVLCGIDRDDWPRIQAVVAEVHDVERRVAAISGMLAEQGFAHVHATQDWINEGTDVYTVHAHRRQPAPTTAAVRARSV